MSNKPFFIVLGALISHILLGQPHHEARMLGLNGSYTTLAKGYQSIGVNPANLSKYNTWSINILNISMGLSNNAFSISNYNAISGANLEDPSSFTYYPKSHFYESFGGDGIRLMQSLELPFPIINFSTRHFAFTSSLSSNIDIGLPNGFLDLLLYGNPIGKNISIDIQQFVTVTQETGLSHGHSFNSFSFGFTLKYILGLFYMGMESLENPYITTDITGFTGQNQYVIQQAIGGSGIGVDIGISTHESEEGYSFGMAVVNLLGMVEWTQDNFIRKRLEDTLEQSAGDFYLRPNEFMYVNMVMDSVTGQSFSEISGDPLIYYEMYKVFPLNNIDSIQVSSEDSARTIELSDYTYLFPSSEQYKLVDLIGDSDISTNIKEKTDDNYDKYYTEGDNNFKTRQPMYLRIGISKRWVGQAVVAADIVTGFSDQYGASATWRASIGTEINRFNGRFIRLGYAIGGLTNKSMSVGYGRELGQIYWDIGISFNGGFSLETAKGIDIAMGLTWKLKTAKD